MAGSLYQIDPLLLRELKRIEECNVISFDGDLKLLASELNEALERGSH